MNILSTKQQSDIESGRNTGAILTIVFAIAIFVGKYFLIYNLFVAMIAENALDAGNIVQTAILDIFFNCATVLLVTTAIRYLLFVHRLKMQLNDCIIVKPKYFNGSPINHYHTDMQRAQRGVIKKLSILPICGVKKNREDCGKYDDQFDAEFCIIKDGMIKEIKYAEDNELFESIKKGDDPQ